MIYDDAPAKKMFIHIYDLRMAEYDAANASRDSACDGSWAGSDFGCDGVCFSGLVDDECGECGGDGTSCQTLGDLNAETESIALN